MLDTNENHGKFDDQDFFMQNISDAYQTKRFTDIFFVLSDGVTIDTNRYMLAWRSEYFASMLFGGLKEGNSEKVVLQCSSQIFRLLLDYIWEGKVDVSNLSLHPLLDLMENARMMCLERLVGSIEGYLAHLLESGQVDLGESLILLNFCVLNKFEGIENLALKFVDLNLVSLTTQEHFPKLSSASILSILKNEERKASELEVFKAVLGWMKGQKIPVPNSTKTAMLSLVNLVSISSIYLLKIVRKSGLYDDKAICDALEEQHNKEHENVNVCLEENGGEIVDGVASKGSCIRGGPYTFDGWSGFTYNELDSRITIKFRREYIINKVEFRLWDQDDRTYSYILESSQDGINWSTVLDCTNFNCSSMQTIFFQAKPMKFISVKGIRNSYQSDYDFGNGIRFHIVNILATLDTSDYVEKKNSGMVKF